MVDKKMNFDGGDYANCLRCGKKVHCIETKFAQHCQSAYEIEVCGQCYSDFVELNDIFFRGIV